MYKTPWEKFRGTEQAEDAFLEYSYTGVIHVILMRQTGVIMHAVVTGSNV